MSTIARLCNPCNQNQDHNHERDFKLRIIYMSHGHTLTDCECETGHSEHLTFSTGPETSKFVQLPFRIMSNGSMAHSRIEGHNLMK
jgi:hypothetical protein